MKKRFLLLFRVYFTILVFFSTGCSQENENLRIRENLFKPYTDAIEIQEIRAINQSENDLVLEFIAKAAPILKFWEVVDLNSAKTVTYTNLPGKAIILNLEATNQKHSSENSLILVVNEFDEVITYHFHEKIDNINSYVIRTTIEENEWFVAESDKTTGEILSFNIAPFINAKATEGEGDRMTFLECAEMAVSACVEDGACAFICGIVWKYCLGAVALACLVHSVN